MKKNGTLQPRSSPLQAMIMLAIAAYLLRALVPAGYMIALAADTGVVVTLCGDGAGAKISLDPESGALGPVDKSHDDRRDTAKQSCPFAAAAQPVLLAGTSILAGRLAATGARALAPPIPAPANDAASLPPARAPPLAA